MEYTVIVCYKLLFVLCLVQLLGFRLHINIYRHIPPVVYSKFK